MRPYQQLNSFSLTLVRTDFKDWVKFYTDSTDAVKDLIELIKRSEEKKQSAVIHYKYKDQLILTYTIGNDSDIASITPGNQV